ncbi:hypothetical protein K493DRAFT_309447 [Basidiobolus meristosporus CBS 931.73]|uniref:Uncharacterized protein n=1 Tax=Basidiobolus meristosporus CBS 931.73 TaxID=1314790 RepID=A0A1Y1VVT7_9FUNG|nr:hypothetical protein K493DRAFT_309447 [Basidiobolus meristosporus CBS 931.73]|eukprot:ORX65409.1 hypothetical protein K493DRAFT_309447 [Basidiobolus meristosporus CBS 931.73]
MVYYTSCKVLSQSQTPVSAQCEVPFGTITMGEEWNRIVVAIVSVAQPMGVSIIGLVLWRLWWLNRRKAFPTRKHYGHSWAIATAMTHMPGLLTLLGSLLKIRKFGVKKATVTLILMLFLVGVVVPLLSLLWSFFVIKVDDIPYKLEYAINVNLNNPPLPEAVKSRAPLILSMGKVVYGEKPLLGVDLLKDYTVGIETTEVIPVESHWRWWKVLILPKEKTCIISNATISKIQPAAISYVNFGNNKDDIVMEEVRGRCGALGPTISYFGSQEAIDDNSPIPFHIVESLQSVENQDDWCHIQYSCQIKVHIMRGEILANSDGEVTWGNYSGTYDHPSISKTVSAISGAAKVSDYLLQKWLDVGWNNTWQNKAVTVVKEAAITKYDMYNSLGKYKSAFETLQQTLREFTREATFQQPQVAIVRINGKTKKIQFRWIVGLAWFIAIMISAAAYAICFKRLRSDPLLQQVLDSWQVINRVAAILEETKLGKFNEEQTYYDWPQDISDTEKNTTTEPYPENDSKR